MNPVEVHVFGVQALQARVQCLYEVLAVVSAGVRVSASRGERVLGGYHEPVTLLGNELADVPLAGAVGVPVCCIYEVAAGLDEGLEDLAALFLRGPPPPIFPERHRP